MKPNRFIKSIYRFFNSESKPLKDEISKEEYLTLFIKGKTKDEIKLLFEKVWDSKMKEIDRYLSRSTYAWAFQVASFAGYFSVISSKGYVDNPQVLYIVVCIGVITSFAWVFINKGSKYWQRLWDYHIDMIEDEVIGPLNKVILSDKQVSIGNISDTVSRFIVMIWIILGIKYFHEHISFKWTPQNHIDYVTWLTTIVTFCFLSSMYWGYGRGNNSVVYRFQKK